MAKWSHSCNWKDNPHAKMMVVVDLALAHYNSLKKTDMNEATNFIRKFLKKAILDDQFLKLLQRRLAYPGMMRLLHEFCELPELSNTPLLKPLISAKNQISSVMRSMTNSTSLVQSPHFQEHLDVVDFNPIYLPYHQDVYHTR